MKLKKEFMEYLADIGIRQEVYIKRIEEIYEFYTNTCPEDIEEIFVTDYLTKDGTREYESLWFFSKSYAMEAKNFLTIDEDNFDLAPIRNRIMYWEVKKKNYDFKEANDNSRLHVYFGLVGEISGELKASSKNCDYLRDIFLKFIKTNVVKEKP